MKLAKRKWNGGRQLFHRLRIIKGNPYLMQAMTMGGTRKN